MYHRRSKLKEGLPSDAPTIAPARQTMLERARAGRRPANLSAMPYDIIFLISRACDSREDIAALSLTNNMMHYFLKADVTPALAGYVAIYSLSSENICRVYRLYGPESLRLGLTRINPSTRQYALQKIIDSDDVEIFDLVARFITYADPLLDSLLEHIMARELIHWVDPVVPYLSTGQRHLGLKNAVYGNLEPFARKLLSSMPEDKQPSACDGLMLERVVVRNLREVRALTFDHVTDPSFSGGVHTVLSDYRPQPYTTADICDVVARLLAAGYPPNLVFWGGRNLLHSLAINGPENITGVRRFGPTPVALMPDGDQVHLYCTRALIAAGTDFDLRDNDERTPMFLAVRNGETVMVRELLNAGADVEVVDDTGRTLEDVELFSDHIKVKDCVRLIKDRRDELKHEVDSRAMRDMERALANSRARKADKRRRVPSRAGAVVRGRGKDRKRPASRAVAAAAPSRVIAELDGVAHETEEAVLEPVVEEAVAEPVVEEADVRGAAKKQKRRAKAISPGHRPVTRSRTLQARASAVKDIPAHATLAKIEKAPVQRRVQPPRKAKNKRN